MWMHGVSETKRFEAFDSLISRLSVLRAQCPDSYHPCPLDEEPIFTLYVAVAFAVPGCRLTLSFDLVNRIAQRSTYPCSCSDHCE